MLNDIKLAQHTSSENQPRHPRQAAFGVCAAADATASSSECVTLVARGELQQHRHEHRQQLSQMHPRMSTQVKCSTHHPSSTTTSA